MVNKRNTWLVISVLIVLSMLIVSCGANATPTIVATEEASIPPTEESAPPTQVPELPTLVQPTEASSEPVILRVGGLEDVDCWNPWSCVSIWFFGYFVYEGFTDHGSASSGCAGEPRLADSWEVSDDGLTWTIKLHPGITFNDGTPMTAQTVVDFVNWWNSTDLVYNTAESASMQSIEALDDLTVQYTTADPVVNSPDYDFIWWFIAPPHVWSQFDSDTLFSYESYPPVGTGPYTVAEHVPGSHVTFEARDDYYRGKPPIDRIVYQIYANNDALVSALLSGEIDLTLPTMPPETYATLTSASNVTVEEKAPGSWHELIFNMYPTDTKHPAVDDPKVREAIDYAIDKDKIVEVALQGHGITCATNWGCGPNYDKEMNPDLTVTPFDLTKANQILDEAGYADTDNDGIRETADGTPLIFRLAYQAENPSDLVISDLLSGWLKEVGIQVEVEALELTTWYATIMDERNFDMAIDTEPHDIDPASMDFWYSCWSAEVGSGAMNFPGYCNEEMDNLVYEYWYSDDLEGRWEPMFKAQEILNQDRPIITLAGQNSIQAYRNDRFEFPMDTCDVGLGMMDPASVLNATVKQ
jgi:peptide/nickel transport system substrate-binding protein